MEVRQRTERAAFPDHVELYLEKCPVVIVNRSPEETDVDGSGTMRVLVPSTEDLSGVRVGMQVSVTIEVEKPRL